MAYEKTEKPRNEDRKLGAYRAAAELEKPPDARQGPEPGGDTTPGQVTEAAENGGGSEPLEDRLAAAQNEAKENYDRLLRVSAEFDNYKKRAAREANEYRKFANESLLRELLPVIDSLERALEVPSDAQNEAALREGIELTLRQIYKLLENFGTLPIQAEGLPFDPACHQAILQEPSDQAPENTVIRQMQKGYTIHDRLLRPAMVVVAKAAGGGDDASPAGDKAEAQSY
jgi:molecular chaperone GrpE